MSEKKDEKIIGMNPEDTENSGTQDIKATDFIEPQGKVRKAVKWLLGGVVIVVSGFVGGLIGHKLGSGGNDKEDNQETEESSDEPTDNE